MKILVLLLCFIAAQQCLPWEASRILKEAEGNQAFTFLPRRLLLEADDEGDGMEAETILPDASDGAKSEILIKEDKKMSSKQEEDLVMEAIAELISNEKQLKNQGNKSILSNIKEDELPSKGGKEENWVGDEAKKERAKDGTNFASTDNERSDMLSREKLQEESDKKVKMKKQASKIDRNFEPTKDKKNFDADGESVQEFSDRSTGESNVGDSLLATGEGEKSLKLKGKMEDKGVKATKKADKWKKEVKEKGGFSGEVFDIETTKSIENGFEEGLLETKESGDKVKVSRRKQSDADDLAGFGMMEISKKETPADLVEMERQGELEELMTSSAKERKGGGKNKDKEDGKEEEKPWKRMKSQKKSKVQVLQEADSGLTGFDATEYQTKRTKKSDFQSDIKEWSDVSSTETPGLMSEQADLQGTSKSQMKKTKKVKSDRLKEGNSYVNDEKNFDKTRKNPDKANEEFRKVASNGKYSPRQGLSSVEKVKKLRTTDETEEGYQNSKSDDGNRRKDKEELKTLEVTDPKHASTARSKVMQQGDENENISKGGQHRLSTNVNKEERLDQQLQGINAKTAQERAEASIVSNTAGSSIGVDEEEDEYSDFMQDFSDWSMKFQDTAYKVADHLGPNLQKLTDTSKTYFNKANQQITESFSPLVGKQFAPFFASLLSYGLLLVPLVVVIILFEHIRAMLSLQKVLLFVNIYLAAYFATLLLATFIMGEPMNFFYKSSANGYVHLQLLQALGYIIYLVLQTIDLASSCSSEACSIKVTVVLQWFVAVVIGFHYYVTVFHRAMVLKGPHTNWKIYGIYSSAFGVLCLFARIKRVKKGYVHVGQPDTDKKH